jgi:hypothetical protein
MGEIVIEEINYRAIIYSGINISIFLSAIMLAIYGFDHHMAKCWLPGLMISIVVSFFLIDSLLKAAKVKKLLTITREGIIDNSSDNGLGFISFDDIKEFKIVTVHNKKAIAVIPKNINGFSSKHNTAKHRFSKRNVNKEAGHLTIFINRAKDIAPEDILSLLQKRLADVACLN